MGLYIHSDGQVYYFSTQGGCYLSSFQILYFLKKKELYYGAQRVPEFCDLNFTSILTQLGLHIFYNPDCPQSVAHVMCPFDAKVYKQAL